MLQDRPKMADHRKIVQVVLQQRLLRLQPPNLNPNQNLLSKGVLLYAPTYDIRLPAHAVYPEALPKGLS